MEHAPKINKVEVRTLQMADYRQLSQSFTRVYSDGSDVFWTREQIKKLITISRKGRWLRSWMIRSWGAPCLSSSITTR